MSANAGSIKAGRAYVQMGVEDEGFKQGMVGAERMVRMFGDTVETEMSRSAKWYDRLAMKAKDLKLDARQSGEAALAGSLKGGVANFAGDALGLGVGIIAIQGLAASIRKTVEEIQGLAAKWGEASFVSATGADKLLDVMKVLPLGIGDAAAAGEALGMAMYGVAGSMKAAEAAAAAFEAKLAKGLSIWTGVNKGFDSFFRDIGRRIAALDSTNPFETRRADIEATFEADIARVQDLRNQAGELDSNDGRRKVLTERADAAERKASIAQEKALEKLRADENQNFLDKLRAQGKALQDLTITNAAVGMSPVEARLAELERQAAARKADAERLMREANSAGGIDNPKTSQIQDTFLKTLKEIDQWLQDQKAKVQQEANAEALKAAEQFIDQGVAAFVGSLKPKVDENKLQAAASRGTFNNRELRDFGGRAHRLNPPLPASDDKLNEKIDRTMMINHLKNLVDLQQRLLGVFE